MSSLAAELVSGDVLVVEIERYLATVDFFRGQGCEPEWSSEAAEHAQTVRVDGETLIRATERDERLH